MKNVQVSLRMDGLYPSGPELRDSVRTLDGIENTDKPAVGGLAEHLFDRVDKIGSQVPENEQLDWIERSEHLTIPFCLNEATSLLDSVERQIELEYVDPWITIDARESAFRIVFY